VTRGAGGCRVYLPARNIGECAVDNVTALLDDTTVRKPETSTDEIARGMVRTPGPKEGSKVVSGGIVMSTVTESIAARRAVAAEGSTGETVTLAREGEDERLCAVPDAKIGSKTGIASAAGTPFVVVNTTLKVPTLLLSNANRCETTVERTQISTVETTRTGVENVGDASGTAAMTPTNSEWGRHGYIIAEIYRILGTMEPPWGSQCVFEAAARRFPEVDTTALRMTVLAVLLTQRQCIRDLTLAGARRGPRRDENG